MACRTLLQTLAAYHTLAAEVPAPDSPPAALGRTEWRQSTQNPEDPGNPAGSPEAGVRSTPVHRAPACSQGLSKPTQSPCKRARVVAAAAGTGARLERARASSREGLGLCAEGSPPKGPAADHAQRLLQQMLAALTGGDPAGANPRAPSCGGPDGAVRRSAALERLAQARRPPGTSSVGTGHGLGSAHPEAPAAGPTDQGCSWAPTQSAGAGLARGVPAHGPSLVLFADGCMPAQRSCSVTLFPGGSVPAAPPQPPAPALVSGHHGPAYPADAAPPIARAMGAGRGLGEGPPWGPEGGLPRLQAGLQPAASPATATFLDVRTLMRDLALLLTP